MVRKSIGYKGADVVVAGGGPGGFCAAIAAARNNVDVLLVEQLGFLGGMFTGGNMCVSNSMPWAGLGKEIFDRLIDMGAARYHPIDPPNYPAYHYGKGVWHTVPYDPEMAKIILFQMAEEGGVRLLLRSYVTGTVADGNALRGIVVENKSGRQVVMGKVICDGTGDGDVAASAGVPFVKGMGEDKKLFPMTMLVRLSHVEWPKASEYSKKDPGWDNAIQEAIAKGELPYYKPRTSDMVPYWGHPRPELSRLWYDDGALLWGGTVEADGTDADSLSHAEVECRKQWMSELEFLKKHIPGFESARVEFSGVTIGVRDTRHLVGEYTYTGYDIVERREFPDTVAFIVPLFLGVPYGCLVPKKIDYLLISSRCISTTPGSPNRGPKLGAYNAMKSMVTVMTYGQAAGTAAALCAKMGVTPRELDVEVLQKTLTEQGALIDRSRRTQLMEEIICPNGITYAEHLRCRREHLRQHWEKKGYHFSSGQTELQ